MPAEDMSYYQFGDFRLDVSKGVLFKNGENIPLTQKSFELLNYLVRNEGKIISKKDFFEVVWDGNFVDDTNLTQHIYRIRKAIEDGAADAAYIETIPKCGYRFVGKVEKFTEDQTAKLSARELLLNENAEKILSVGENQNGVSENGNENKISETSSERKNFPVQNRGTSIFFANPKIILGALCLIIGLSAILFYFEEKPGASNLVTKGQTVAVLPFKQIGFEKDEKLSLGMADSIIAKLGNLDEVSVRPINSVASFASNDSARSDENLFEIGEKLGVDILLTGTVQKENNTVRFNLMLYHVREKHHLCAIKYDEIDAGAFQLQDKIAEQVLLKFVSDLNAHEKIEKINAKNNRE